MGAGEAGHHLNRQWYIIEQAACDINVYKMPIFGRPGLTN